MNYLILFIIGGSLLVGIKYLSTCVDIKYASMLASFPLGLLTGLIITDRDILNYSLNYSKNTLILLSATIIQYVLLKLGLNRMLVLVISVLIWIILNIVGIISF
jgi:hypothetical protein